MSKNPEKMIVELKREDRDLLKSAIDAVSKSHEHTKPEEPPVEKPSEESHTKTHTLEELLDCPECYPKVKRAVIEKEFKGAEYECEECGLPVRKEESEKDDWKCANCGHDYARSR